MSNAFKAVVVTSVDEEASRVGFLIPAGGRDVVEAVADRVADHAETQALALVEQVSERYGQAEADWAHKALTEAGFITEPEPEPEPEQATESSDEEAPGWFKSFADGITSRLSTLEGVARDRGLL